MSRINQRALTDIRLARGLAVRQLARDSGIEIEVLNRLETSDNPSLTTISLAAFLRLAEHLNVHPSALLEDDTPTSCRPGTPDSQRLGALLTALGQNTAIVAIADALGWDKPRLQDAIDNLAATLRSAGIIVFQHNGLVSLRPADESHADAVIAIARHPRARARQRLLTPARARIVYRAARQPISPHSISSADRLNISVLLKAQILVEDNNRHYIPSPDVVESLNPPPL